MKKFIKDKSIWWMIMSMGLLPFTLIIVRFSVSLGVVLLTLQIIGLVFLILDTVWFSQDLKRMKDKQKKSNPISIN